MTGQTTIEWNHQPGFKGDVWNPTTGCTRVSAGCDNCYAFALHDKRYKGQLAAAQRQGFHTTDSARTAIDERKRRGESRLFTLPLARQYDTPFSRVQLIEERLDAPLRKRTPTCYFVDSMADLFHEDVPDAFLDRTFAAMSWATKHRFLILTKRPERMRAYLTDPATEKRVEDLRCEVCMVQTYAPCGFPGDDCGHMGLGYWPLPNVWLGTSVEDQKAADERIPHLLATPAAVRFLSCEPLLGPVDLTKLLGGTLDSLAGDRKTVGGEIFAGGHGLDWVIIGGESGSRARPMDLEWARSLVGQCRSAGVAPFVKQLGSKPEGRTVAFVAVGDRKGDAFAGGWTTAPLKLRESHGRDMSEWPEDLRVREFPVPA